MRLFIIIYLLGIIPFLAIGKDLFPITSVICIQIAQGYRCEYYNPELQKMQFREYRGEDGQLIKKVLMNRWEITYDHNENTIILAPKPFAFNENFTITYPGGDAEKMIKEAEAARIKWYQVFRPDLLKDLNGDSLIPEAEKGYPCLPFPEKIQSMISIDVKQGRQKHAFTWPASKPTSAHTIRIAAPTTLTIKQTMLHEISHTENLNNYGDVIPRFIDEGMASYISKDFENGKIDILQKIKYGAEILNLSNLFTVNTLTNDEGEFFGYAVNFIEFMLYKNIDIDTFIKAYIKNKNLDDAAKTFGYKNSSSLETDFQSFLRKKALEIRK